MSERDDAALAAPADGTNNARTGLISGRFRLGELLGTGGSASVFAAVDERAGSSVALKILHPHLSQRPAARDAFLAEARRAEPLRHPNIVRVLGVGVDDSAELPIAWIALERAEGSSLSEHVAGHGPLSPAAAVAVVDGVLRALEAAHAIGLTHRDVSPSNVMVAADVAGRIDAGGVRLLDFGMADAAGESALGTDDLLSVEAEGRAGVIGNVNYMSPEHVRGMPVDERGDLYQVGALLHFTLTGRPPFPRATTGQTMRAHLDTPPPVPSVTDSRIPRALDRIVVRAMLKDPGDRFPSAAAMRSAVVELDLGGRGPQPAELRPPVTDAAAPSTTDVPLIAPSDTVVVVPAASVSAGREAQHDGVTRVLGRTVVPPRAPGPVTAPSVRTAGGPRRARSRGGTWFAAAAAVSVVAIVVVFAATSVPTASVEAAPSVVPTVFPSPSETEPQPGPERPAGPVVSQTTVPGLARLSVAEAVRALAEAGLVAGEVTYVDSPFLRDIVLESNPAAGHRLGARSAVALTVASGSNTIPDVAGQDRSAAAAAMQAAGFVPSFAPRWAPAGSAPGTVLGTSPGAGAGLAVGETVTLFEADPDDRQPTATPTPTSTRPGPSPTPTPDPGDEG